MPNYVKSERDGDFANPVILYMRNPDGGLVRPELDPISYSMNTVDLPHHKIHAGEHYFVEGYTELNDTDTFFIKLVTPNILNWAHFICEVLSTGVLTVTLDEDATGGMTGGSELTPINNDRNSGRTSGITITSGVTTCTGYTTRIGNQKIGVALNPAKILGGCDARVSEIILKQNTVYCRSFTSGSNSNIVNFKSCWYEHTNK